MTTLPDGRIEMVCRDCGDVFAALGEWQTRCRTCYAVFKAGPDVAALRDEIRRLRESLAESMAEAERLRKLAQRKPKAARTTKARIPPDHWRRLVQLAHPDKHAGSDAANEATRWLLENRP